jgi:hypothetical protein
MASFSRVACGSLLIKALSLALLTLPLVTPQQCATVPILTLTTTSSYTLGFETGLFSRNLTLSFFSTADNALNATLLPFYESERGKGMVEMWIAATRGRFPEVAQELDGMADGIGWPRVYSWLVNMQEEIESFSDSQSSSSSSSRDHCSDVVVNYGPGFRLHGHNEDGDRAVAKYAFFLNATVNGTSLFYYMYPGQIAGTAFGFGRSKSSLFFSQSENSMYPSKVGAVPRAGDVPVNMLARAALYAGSPSEAAAIVSAVSTSWGMNLNFMAAGDDEALDVEVGPGSLRAVKVINTRPGNLPENAHFNEYKWMLSDTQETDPSSEQRAKRVTELGVPVSVQQMITTLGDDHNKAYPIYRDGQPPDSGVTLATQIVDMSDAGAITVYQWCGSNPKTAAPRVLKFL